MNENQPADSDETLSKLLRTWKPEAQLPPRFQEGVWRGIERAESQDSRPLWHRLVARVQAALARPALAASYITVLLFAGLGAGYWRAADLTSHAQSEWRVRYVQSVDPYRMPR
jgi:hypothetical protein